MAKNEGQKDNAHLHFLGNVLSRRVAAMGPEFLWANGQSVDGGFVEPPAWVGNLIRLSSPMKSHASPNIEASDLASFFGLATAMRQGAEAMMSDAENEKMDDPDKQAAFEAMRDKLSPLFEENYAQVDANQNAIQSFVKKDTKSLVAYSEAHHETSEYVAKASNGEDVGDTVTDELILA